MIEAEGLPSLEVLAPLVDYVLERGEPMVVLHYGIVLVPDTLIVEGMANGHEMPGRGPSIVRPADGRTVSVFAVPEDWERSRYGD